MIDTIIENSYQKKVEIRKKISMDEAEKNEVFHQIKNENYESSTLIDNKVKKADFTINSNIDNLLSYSVVDADNKKIREQLLKFQKEIIASEPLIMKAKKKKNKHLFKGDFTLSEKMQKTNSSGGEPASGRACPQNHVMAWSGQLLLLRSRCGGLNPFLDLVNHGHLVAQFVLLVDVKQVLEQFARLLKFA